MKIKRVLISVSDKTGIVKFAKSLQELGVEIISTSGTSKLLKENGVKVVDITDITNFPEMLGGRVKTLNPKIFGGILYRRENEQDNKQIAEQEIKPIDMVVVNLYPFAETAKNFNSVFEQEVIEKIDIGGPSLLRASAKNFKDVSVICNPQDYTEILKELKENKGEISLDTKKLLASKTFKHTAVYDAQISTKFDTSLSQEFPEQKVIVLNKLQNLRYGENPHQNASLYSQGENFSFKQLHGKELSYNNILDAFGTWDAVSDFEDPACVVFKHGTPCGIGKASKGEKLYDAFSRAWECDPLSAFGGIVAVNKELDEDIAEKLSKVFVEVVCAPSFSKKAEEILTKKKNIRLLTRDVEVSKNLWFKSVGDEVLVTYPNGKVFGDKFECVTKRKPTKDEEEALKFAWASVKHIKSNAIVLTTKNASVGIGAGQMSRVDSSMVASKKYETFLKENSKPEDLVLGSDAFFPFQDAVDMAVSMGVSAIIQPGGSVRDDEVIKACNEHDISMVFTGLRHFRH